MPDFADWYKLYPRKIARADAEKAYTQVIRKGCTHDELVRGVTAYIKLIAGSNVQKQFVPYPASWLRDQRWLDEELKPMADNVVLPIPDSWSRVSGPLIAEIGLPAFSAWFGKTTFDPGPPPVIFTPNAFLARKIGDKFRFQLARTISEAIEIKPLESIPTIC